MSIIIDLDNNKNNIFQESVIGLGNFDGLHLGHRDIISKVIEISKNKNVKSSVLIFKQHTNEIFPSFPKYYITSLNDKIKILENLGIDIIYLVNFTLEFAKLDSEEFIFGFIKNKLNVNTLVCGPDYTFGKKDIANTNLLLKYKNEGRIGVEIVDYVMENCEKISSTLIREYINNGEVERVKHLITTNYKISGTVIHGFKIGSAELGYPTANISLDFNYIIPKEGVYLTYAYHNGKKYVSLTSIGTNPTVTDNQDIKIEVYILDFNKRIYGDKLEIEFILRMRDQIKFNTKEELIKCMDNDYKYALKFKNEIK
ncbi:MULTISPECIES: bifunctional riboflavin kinase/FAD synthetase [Helcococcus]|uniref:Riboflavin biosynthesis protein n=1 Tax=Helcococcus bovis TaxID=3153252 RepID=A0ABW9F784_9FIRM